MTGDEHVDELRSVLRELIDGQTLSEARAWGAFEQVMAGHATDAQIGALLTAMTMRPGGPTVEEITGAARAMRNHAMKIDVPEGLEVIDTCGTGGDRSGTFNISTTAALIAAGAGAYVAKHGNRSVTSKSGSSQVLQALGVKLEVGRHVLTECLTEARICFCFAPAHHPAMKHAIGPRQQLGFRTIFNLLGPLTNPAGATRQVIGVYNRSLIEPIAQVLAKLGSQRAMVVHGQADGGGIDELSTMGITWAADLKDGAIEQRQIHPQDVGIESATLFDLQVDTVEASAAVLRDVLRGEKGPARDIAALNAAAALVVAGLADDLPEGLGLACESVDSGRATAALDKLIHITNHA